MERLAFSFFLFGDGSRRRPDRLFSFFRPSGLRTKTEFIGFAGSRTQTLQAVSDTHLKLPTIA